MGPFASHFFCVKNDLVPKIFTYSESSISKLKFVYNICMSMQFENSSKLAFSSRWSEPLSVFRHRVNLTTASFREDIKLLFDMLHGANRTKTAHVRMGSIV